MTEPETLAITGMSHGAFGLGTAENGIKVFVENACPGDKLLVEFYDKRSNFAYAKIQELIEPSSLRMQEPQCKIHKICGSCQWQHIAYEEQLKFKKKNLEDFLTQADLDLTFLDALPDLVPMSDPWFYRNKVIYPVHTVPATGRLQAGYYQRNSHDLINVKYCPIQYSVFDEIMARIKELASLKAITDSVLRHIQLRANQDQSEILCTLIVRKKLLTEANKQAMIELFGALQQEFSQIKTCTLNYNDDSTNVILGQETEVITGPGFINESFLALNLQIASTSFFQVNIQQFTKILYTISQQLESGSKVLDAYCGAGTISLALAKLVGDLQITGIEVVASAIADAKRNAATNNIEAEFLLGKVEDHVQNLRQESFDYLIVNPPRKGCTKQVLDFLLELGTSKIVYLSCNPATLVRDLKYLEGFSYRLEFIQAFDMFPHSFHFETLAILSSFEG